MSAQVICKLSDLKDRDARGFNMLRGDGSEIPLIVVRKGVDIFVYRNRCPHTSIPLEWQPDQFFDLSESFLQCATHGALFRPEDGYCVLGPCAGDSLEPIPTRIVDDEILVEA